MEQEKKVVKIRHLKILKVLFTFFAVCFGLIFYDNSFGQYLKIISALQNGSLILLIFVFLFVIFNAHLVSGDLKSKRILDHLIFFSFVYYMIAYSVDFLDSLNNATLLPLANSQGLTVLQLCINQFVLSFLIPVLVMITSIISVRNVAPVTKKDSATTGSRITYYILIFLSLLGLGYSIMTALYSIA